ncbi:SDR family oxidoreductase [Agrobacterium sp. T29]|uniref:SDR family NAD(P)-dependent oxidoreductase n=1 Tax=Agrobacterium sp. T29 TaxID=2580515 RepID=UPI00115C48EB|nr:SDR family oxidoreductase [Agrobacterium sp. T29]
MKNCKVMLITGGASGIGAATVRMAAAQGHNVVIADINDEAAQNVARSAGSNVSSVRLDICSEANWKEVLDKVWADFGRLDVLINNAAIAHTGYAVDVSIAKHQHTINTNFMGAVISMLETLPRFKQQGFGHIVNISSMNAFLPFPGIASYSAAKHALRAFHHAVAIEERKGTTDFTIVYPTATETPMLEQEAEDDAMALAFAGDPVTPEAVAAAILRGIKNKSDEVYIPASRGSFVRKTGVRPQKLRELYDRNEIIGAEKLKQRRERIKAKA